MAIIAREIGVVVRVTHKFLSVAPKLVPSAVINMAPSVTLQNDDALLSKTKHFAANKLP